MTAKQVKNKLQKFLFNKGFHLSCTELSVGCGWADVFSLQKNKYGTEWEVKVSWQDLKSEIDIIRSILNGNISDVHLWDESKRMKHQAYTAKGWLFKKYFDGRVLMPHKFCFVVDHKVLEKMKNQWDGEKHLVLLGEIPSRYDDFVQLCTKAGYGIYSMKESGGLYFGYNGAIEKILQPKFIHKEIQPHLIHAFAQRCFIENYNNHISKQLD